MRWDLYGLRWCTHLFIFPRSLEFLCLMRPAAKRPGAFDNQSAGPVESVARANGLARFLARRNGCLGRLRRFQLDFAFDKVAFLLLVLFVRAGVNILDPIHERLILR